MTNNKLIGYARVLDHVLFTTDNTFVVNTMLIPITSEDDFQYYNNTVLFGVEVLSPVVIRVFGNESPTPGDVIEVVQYDQHGLPKKQMVTHSTPEYSPTVVGIVTMLDHIIGCGDNSVYVCNSELAAVIQAPLFSPGEVEYLELTKSPTVGWNPVRCRVTTNETTVLCCPGMVLSVSVI